MKLIKHNTAEDILLAYWKITDPELTIEDLLSSEMGGYDSAGNEINFNAADEIQAFKDCGFWGFSDTINKEVHVWVEDKSNPERLIFFLAHEIGHSTGNVVDTGDEIKDLVREEERANQFGEVAQQAFIWLKQLL